MSLNDVSEPMTAAPATPPARLQALQRRLAANIDDTLPAHASVALAAVVSGGRVGSPSAGAAVYRDSSRRARARSLDGSSSPSVAQPTACIELLSDLGFHAGGYIATCNKPSIASCSGVGVLV